MTQTLNGVLLSFEAAVFESGIRLKTNIQPGIFFNGDKESFERLINILMDNAIKNTPQGGVISVLLSCDRGIVKIVVKNTDPGIPPEDIDKIFERFYRSDTSRTRESGGYGLGLAIARAIVQKHHGRIYAQSNVNETTSFIVELPQGRK
ncbi:MAG: sensor histidine kinase [Firmicutes bacterium]|nr:sensor histidine kinase [Bacillota bacterium]